ncbi:hypothetical protein BDF21DRAFT_161701 [Thamnidium elegans]|nr:hypothetical protein BDF21DRAFT_161701 [Thamnidium elegans]
MMSLELLKTETESKSGYVTSIHILSPDKRDRRMGHSDPQLLLGYSTGAILIYRYRANIYAITAKRLRAPIDLSEFTEFPYYPITHLCGVRSYNSLGMTVVFAQEKPLDDVKYEYSRSYIKIVDTHGDSTRKQRKIINPTHMDSTILLTDLVLPPFKTTEFDPVIQLSIVLENKDTFELQIWSISPTHVQRDLGFELDKETWVSVLPGRGLRVGDLFVFYQHTPQTQVHTMLEYHNEQSNTKRKAKGETSNRAVKKKHKKTVLPTDSLGLPKLDSEMDDYQNIPTKDESALSSQKNADSTALAEDSDLMDFDNMEPTISANQGHDSGFICTEQLEQASHATGLEEDQIDNVNTSSDDPPVTNDVNISNTTRFKSIQEPVNLIETNESKDSSAKEPIEMTEEGMNAGEIEVALPGKADALSAKEIVEGSSERTETDMIVEDTGVKPEHASTVYESSNEQVDVPETKNAVAEDTDVKPTEQSIADEPNDVNEETMKIVDTKEMEESITMDEYNDEETVGMLGTEDVTTEITDVEPTERSVAADNHSTEEMMEPMDVYNTIPVDETNEQKLKDDYTELVDDLMEIVEPDDAAAHQDSTAEAAEEEEKEITEVSDQGVIEMLEEAIKMAETIHSISEEVEEKDQASVTETNESTDETRIEQEMNESIETNDLTAVDNTVETTQEDTLTVGGEYTEGFEMVQTTAEPDQTGLLQQVESLSANQPHLDNNYNPSMQLLEEPVIRGNLLEVVEQVTSAREESKVLQEDQLESDQEYATEQSVEPTPSLVETSFLAESEHDMLESTIEIGSSDSEIDATDVATDKVVSGALAPSDLLSHSDISFEEDDEIPDDDHHSFEENDDIPDYEHDSFGENDDIPDYEHESFDGDDIPNYEQEYFDENGIPDYEPESSGVSYNGDQSIDAVDISDDSDALEYQGDTGEHDGLDSQGDIGEQEGNGVYDENEEASIILGSEDSEDSDHAGEISLRSEDQIESMEEEDSLAVETDVSGVQSLITSPSAIESRELTPVQDEEVDMEQVLKHSEQKFSELLYQVTGEEDLSSFMEQPLIPREQLNELGISCWYNPDPHMKLTLVRYCDKHNLGTKVVPLCYTLKKSKKDLTKDEIDEYTAIYKKHLFKFPMYNKDINVFDVEGHQQLLKDELNYYKKSTTGYTDPEAAKNRKIYNDYYGFGLL